MTSGLRRGGVQLMLMIGVIAAGLSMTTPAVALDTPPAKPKVWAATVCQALSAAHTDLEAALAAVRPDATVSGEEGKAQFVATYTGSVARMDQLLAIIDAAGVPRGGARLQRALQSLVVKNRDYFEESEAKLQATPVDNVPAFIAAISAITVKLRDDPDLGTSFFFVKRLGSRYRSTAAGAALRKDAACHALTQV
jgi:hypothetical protein